MPARRPSRSPSGRRRCCAARRQGRGRRSSSATGSRRRGATSSTARGRWRGPATASSPTTRAGTASPSPAPAGEGYGYPRLVADLERVVAAAGGRGALPARRPLDGRPHRGRLRARHPERLAGPGRDRPGLPRARSTPESLAYWDGLAAALERGRGRRLRRLHRRAQGIDPRWRDSVLRFTRERMLRSRQPRRRWRRRCARCRARGRSSRSRSSSALDVPALVVASHDDADPGHPYAVAEAYAEALPRARLISEDGGRVAARLAGRQALARV